MRRSFIVRGASFARGDAWGVLSGAESGPTAGASGSADVFRRFGTAVSVTASLRFHRMAAEFVPQCS